LLQPGDLLVDGANGFYQEAMRRAGQLAGQGLRFADVGVSGGVWGLANGYCLMAGGAVDDVARLKPYLQALAPTPETGWLHAGPAGRGHFTKMVHNGIEYGMMQALAEGFALMQRASRNSSSTSLPSPNSGDTVRWCVPGCSTCPPIS
jgi:6-phosphogluconate dehydrogenase